MTKQNRARLKLIGIFMLFLGPLLLAFIMYYGFHGLRSGGATNKGILLTPAKPLPGLELRSRKGATTSADVLRRQWTFLQVAPDGCGKVCRDSLEETYQIWLLLHDERDRVQRVLLVGGALPHMQRRPRLEVYRGDLSALRELIQQHDAGRPGTVYLVDPHGNWVLYYPPEQDGEGLFQDTKHLLKLSHIG